MIVFFSFTVKKFIGLKNMNKQENVQKVIFSWLKKKEGDEGKKKIEK